MTRETDAREADVLVVGSGVAGCAAALAAARAGAEVLVATKATAPEDAATHWAQGGVAVTGSDPESFREDVLAAGDGAADPEAVDVLVGDAREAVTDVLVDTLGVPFDGASPGADLGAYDRGREAAHSARRILHVDASTGRHVLRPFLNHLRDREEVTFLEDATALDVLTHEGRVHGVELLHEGAVEPVFAGATVLATGGIGACYGTTTNPPGATGDGVAMAALAGARVADMQYVQFHPTAYPGDDPFLVSEAVRGEGAVLRDGEGQRFMPAVHDDAELAPRDVVARAVADARERTGEVRLDVSPVDPDFESEFPDLTALCTERGIDPSEGIPVAPAEHYLCGGVAVDERGRTTLDRLFAAGECARTGVHGANRLASTSLLEGLVWGLRAGQTAADAGADGAARIEAPEPLDRDPELPDAFADAKYARLRETMDAAVGIERTPSGLERARSTLRRLKGEVDAYIRTRVSRSLYELRNATVCALLVARAASDAPSAGCHRVVGGGDADGPHGGARADD